ncbi:MAG: serine/threonine protein kinase [Polyangiaceae bacterium]|nr:serine/threonine protein kinase [Polyangiaceae bacterium]
MAQAELNVRPGEILAGKYAVERVLGQGGMGAVLAVRHVMLDERRALKLMLPSAMGGHQAVERFVREARAAARLKSDHVTRVHDVGLLPTGQPYIEMELLEGQDLSTILATRGPLPAAEVVGWMLQVCEALQEAHASGVVHRDLKPANLFLTHRPNGAECIKVLDFGVAKIQGAQDTSLTTTGTALGSPLYMSPEQMYGASHAEPRSDIWSLGVIMFQLLTQKVPFNGESVTAVALAVVNMPTPSVAALRGDLPPALEAVVMRCLQKPTAARYGSAAELAAALRAARDGGPAVDASPASSHPALPSQSGAAAYGLGGEGPASQAFRPPAPSLSALLPASAAPLSGTAIVPPPAGVGAPPPAQNASTFDTPVSIMPRPQARRRVVVPLLVGLSVAAVGLLGAVIYIARTPSAEPGATPSSSESAPLAPAAKASATAIAASADVSVPATSSALASTSQTALAVADGASSSVSPSSSGKSATTTKASDPQPPRTATAVTTTTTKKGGGFTGVD